MATTQVAHPWWATLRTIDAAAVGLFPLPNGILATSRDWMTQNTAIVLEWLFVVLNGTLVAALALTALVTRILALPEVFEWTRKHLSFLSPDGKPAGRHEAI